MVKAWQENRHGRFAAAADALAKDKSGIEWQQLAEHKFAGMPADTGVNALPCLIDPPLEFIKLRKPSLWRQVYIVSRKDGQLSTAAETLQSFLHQTLLNPWDMLDPEHPVKREYLRGC